MAELILNAEVRKATGKEDSKKLRAKLQVPTVVYGRDITPVHCAIEKIQVDKIVRRANRNALYTLKLDNNESRTVIVRDFQKHPISHEYIHIDLQAVQMDKPIKVDVDLEFSGTPTGKKAGGVFTTLCKKVRIEAVPAKIPAVIKLNVDSLDTGDSLHVSDIEAGEFKVITNSKIALCQISKVKEEAGDVVAGSEAGAGAGAGAVEATKKAK